MDLDDVVDDPFLMLLGELLLPEEVHRNSQQRLFRPGEESINRVVVHKPGEVTAPDSKCITSRGERDH
jgi:hypothetical protein